MPKKTNKFKDFDQSGVYILKNKANNKFYIGSTVKKFNKRWGSHLSNLRNNKHGNKKLQNAFNKYGEENFEFKVLEEIDSEKGKEYIQERENYWFSVFDPFGDRGYNISKEAAHPNPREYTYQDRIDSGKSKNPDGYLVTFPTGLVLHTYNISLFLEEWPELEIQTSGLTACARGEIPQHKGFKCCFANPNDRIEWKPPEPKPVRYVIYNPSGERFEVNDLNQFCRDFGFNDSAHSRFSMVASTYAEPDYTYKRYHVENWTCYFIENDPGKYICPKKARGQKKFRLFDSELKEFITQDLTGFAKENGLNRRVLEKCASPDYPNKTYKGWYCFNFDDDSYKQLFKEWTEVVKIEESDYEFIVIDIDNANKIKNYYYLKNINDITNYLDKIKNVSSLKRNINTEYSYKNCICKSIVPGGGSKKN